MIYAKVNKITREIAIQYLVFNGDHIIFNTYIADFGSLERSGIEWHHGDCNKNFEASGTFWQNGKRLFNYNIRRGDVLIPYQKSTNLFGETEYSFTDATTYSIIELDHLYPDERYETVLLNKWKDY